MEMEKLKELVEEFYNYTINISTTESELLEKYYDKLSETERDYLEEKQDLDNEIDRMVKADILWDFVFTPINIIDQLQIDIGTFGTDSYEFREIKDMYKKIQKVFPDFKIKEIEEVE